MHDAAAPPWPKPEKERRPQVATTPPVASMPSKEMATASVASTSAEAAHAGSVDARKSLIGVLREHRTIRNKSEDDVEPTPAEEKEVSLQVSSQVALLILGMPAPRPIMLEGQNILAKGPRQAM
eukprot:m51a1_g13235 hypothetical protein (124) ;mRNA; r:980-2607